MSGEINCCDDGMFPSKPNDFVGNGGKFKIINFYFTGSEQKGGKRRNGQSPGG